MKCNENIYIYIIYTPILRSSASVLGPEREQDRFNQARERAARESKESSKRARKSIERARESNEEARKSSKKAQERAQEACSSSRL
jgi:Na+-translocating ferredoxin:NAD+ oxidoreductase RnfC subunit